MEPQHIGIRELRQHASRYVDVVARGERLGVTVRGKLVAYLVPADEPRGSIIDQLAAAGNLRPASGSIRDLLPAPPAPEGSRPLSEVLAELRDEERW